MNHAGNRTRSTLVRTAAAGAAMSGMLVGLASASSAGTKPRAATVITATSAYEIAHAGQLNTTAFCGKKKITLGIEDGLGTNAWSQSSMAAVRSEAAKCPNVTQDVEVGEGSLQTSISQINSMVSKGDAAITVIPDFGSAELPAITAATKAGVKVVPWAANPGGKDGVNYVSYVDYSSFDAGVSSANWLIKVLGGKGDIIELGGPAGNPVSAATLAGVVSVFKTHPGMKLLTGTTAWAVTNWDPATAQQITASLLAKYPKINGIVSDYGTDELSALQAFKTAGRSFPAVVGADANGLGCLWVKDHASEPNFKLATVSTRNWMGRIAARKAIAAAEGIKDTEPGQYDLTFYENTAAGLSAHCDPSQPTDRYLSDDLTPAVIAKFGKA
jgi:ribose transport system substrate-binding protein